MKALVWNSRSVKSQQVFERVQMLHRFHKITFIDLMELFQLARHINKYKRRVKMNLAISNCNDKIWLFTNHNVIATVLFLYCTITYYPTRGAESEYQLCYHVSIC